MPRRCDVCWRDNVCCLEKRLTVRTMQVEALVGDLTNPQLLSAEGWGHLRHCNVVVMLEVAQKLSQQDLT